MENKKLFRASFTLPNGKRKFVSAATQEALDQKLLDLRMQANMGIDVTNSVTFGEYALRWYRVCKEPNVGANSRASILNALNTHILPYLSGIPMNSITQMQVQYVFTTLNGKSKSLITKVKTTMNEIFNSAIANRIIMFSPVVNITTNHKEKKEKLAMPKAEEAALLEALSKDTSYFGRRAYLFALLGFKTGMRRGELCGLMLSDFNLADHTVSVNRAVMWPTNTQAQISDSRTQTKTKAAHRIIPIPDTAFRDVKAAVLSAYAEAKSLYLFHGEDGNPMSYTELRNLWTRIQKTSPVKFSIHEMRHTYCTRILREVAIKEAQYFMGHASADMTIGVYNHMIESEEREPASDKIRACL